MTTPSQAVHVERTGAVLASDVRTASSIWARFRGLMGRAGLAPGEGLWFPGDASIHMLFMRFAIDAVFLAPDVERHATSAAASTGGAAAGDGWRVVAIRGRLRPWIGVVWYVRGARGCLELDAGAAERAQLQVGDRLRFEAATG
jgi:uncharacterized membrane protein (UPF0127 family)